MEPKQPGWLRALQIVLGLLSIILVLEQLIPWLSGQLGFQGNKLLFIFQGGIFTIRVTSYLMGALVYLRMAVVVAILYQWWRRPADLPNRPGVLELG